MAGPATNSQQRKKQPKYGSIGPAAGPRGAAGPAPSAVAPPPPPPTAGSSGFLDALDLARKPQAATGTMSVDLLANNPNNPEWRTKPEGGEEWDGFVTTIREHGVLEPLVIVTRAAHLAVYPENESKLDRDAPDATHVIIMGHRRNQGAIEAGREEVPVHVNDDYARIDMLLMLIENKHRKGLRPIDEARMYAPYIRQGMPQRKIAEMTGVDQSYVSRRYALLKLTPEAFAASEAGRLGVEDLAHLASKLPYGDEPGSDGSPERLAAQNRALQLVEARGWTGKVAAKFVTAEQESIAKAAADGLEIVDPVKLYGAKAPDHRIYEEDSVAEAQAAGYLQAAVDQDSGELIYYTSTLPSVEVDEDDPARQQEVDREEGRRAQRARRSAVEKLVQSPPAKETLRDLLVEQYVTGTVRYLNESAVRLAHKWAKAAGVVDDDDAKDWPSALVSQDNPQRTRAVWALALAAAESRATSDRDWDGADSAYVRLLIERGEYKPTPWESRRLAVAEHSPDDQ